MLKFKARLKGNLKCVYVTMGSLVMSLFSHDYIKTEIDKLKYLQYSHSAWFLDGRTSKFVIFYYST